jgi:hypothetical protein
MPAPTLDEASAYQPTPTPPRRRRRASALLAAAALVLLAVGVGVSVAIASRPTTTTPAPPDGKHDAFIRKLDTRAGTVVVDVVQVFKDQAAVDAAIQDGRPRDAAQYLSVWVHNQNPRLRTLPLASGFKVDLLGGCEDSTLSRQQVLDKLAGNAKLAGVYYYTLTVKEGAVQRIQEHLAINAC